MAESLPISSSGHIQLFDSISKKFKLSKITIDNSESSKFLMHIPTLIVLFFFLWPKWNYLIFNFPESSYDFVWIVILVGLSNTVTAFFYYFFKVFNRSKFNISIGFFVTFFVLLLSYFVGSGNISEVSIFNAFSIGLVQGISLLPGISRMAVTYFFGYFMGLKPSVSFIYSLTIEFALILAAILKVIFLENFEIGFNLNLKRILIITIFMIMSYKLLQVVLFMAEKNYLWIFGIYMLIPIFISCFLKNR